MASYEATAVAKETTARLRGLIARFDLNQADLAVLCDVSQSQFSKIIRGVRPITLDQLAALCDALEVDLVELMTEVESFVHARDYVSSPVKFVEYGDKLAQPIALRRALLDPWAVAAATRLDESRAGSGSTADSSMKEVPGRDSREVQAATADFVDELWKQIDDTFGTVDAFREALIDAGHHRAAEHVKAHLEGTAAPSQEDLNSWLAVLHRGAQRDHFDLVANETIDEQYDVADSNFDSA